MTDAMASVANILVWKHCGKGCVMRWSCVINSHLEKFWKGFSLGDLEVSFILMVRCLFFF
jgi:hypothetical protein